MMRLISCGLGVSIIIATALAGPVGAPSQSEFSPIRSVRNQVYEYRVHGKVFALFFWFGRDDVGGGTIEIRRHRDGESLLWTDEIEILFGSDPEKVPGKINRWGYGRELSEWEIENGAANARLKSTVFEGFMRHSAEESLADVRSRDKLEKAGGRFWYDGIRSAVGPVAAVSEVRTFSTEKDFDYRNPGPIRCAYRSRLQSGPADKVRKLEKRASLDSAPYGFLTAVRRIIDDVARQALEKKTWGSARPALSYVYNARTYRLSAAKLKIEDRLELRPGVKNTGTEATQVFRNVARLELNIREATSGYDHDFTLWFPLEGPYLGIPLRVEDKPRWWLKLVLDLIPEGESQAAQKRSASSYDDCK